MNNSLVPENDTQELWELKGKVDAVLMYIETTEYPKTEVVSAMLSGKVKYKEDAR